MSHLEPFPGNPPNDPTTEDMKESTQILDDVRFSVDSQGSMLKDKDLNPTLTFEEGWL
jgi:hypothetical protein